MFETIWVVMRKSLYDGEIAPSHAFYTEPAAEKWVNEVKDIGNPPMQEYWIVDVGLWSEVPRAKYEVE